MSTPDPASLSEPVFIYPGLNVGSIGDSSAEGVEYLGEASLEGRLIDLTSGHGLVFDDLAKEVRGHLFMMTRDVVRGLDRKQDVGELGFKRRMLPLTRCPSAEIPARAWSWEWTGKSDRREPVLTWIGVAVALILPLFLAGLGNGLLDPRGSLPAAMVFLFYGNPFLGLIIMRAAGIRKERRRGLRGLFMVIFVIWGLFALGAFALGMLIGFDGRDLH